MRRVLSVLLTKATLTTAAMFAAVVLYVDAGACWGAAPAVPPVETQQSSQGNAYRAAFPLAAGVYRDVNRVRNDVAQAGLPALLPDSHKVVAAAESLEDAILDRLPMAEVQHRLQLFNDVWEPFVARAGPAFSGFAGALTDIDKVNAGMSSLRGVLEGKGKLAYDQLLAIGLSRQLREEVVRLIDKLVAVRPAAADLIELQGRARWVQRHAKDLALAIDHGTDQGVIADELRQFDGVWKNFVRLARTSPQLDEGIQTTMSQIVEIEHRLRKEMAIPASPTAAGGLDRQFADVAAAANDLVLSLKAELPQASAGVQNAARDFYLQAENCSLWLLDHPTIEMRNRSFRAMMDSWTLLRAELDGIDRARAPASLEQADRLAKDVGQIESRLFHASYGSPTDQTTHS